jgi:hypothetical protein
MEADRKINASAKEHYFTILRYQKLKSASYE